MKKILALVLAAVMVLGLVACGQQAAPAASTAPAAEAPAAEAPAAEAPAAEAPATEAEEVTYEAPELVFQIGYTGAPNDDNYNYYLGSRFAEKVATATNGRIEIQQMHSNQLGGERDMIEGMQLGTVDMAIINNSSVSNFFPSYLIYDLPYFYKDAETAFKVMDSDLAKRIDDATYENEGIKIIARGYTGFRHIINNVKPIVEVEDLQNMKFRVPETPLSLATFKALGTNSTIMAWGEVITALQQNTIDGMEVNIAAIWSEGVYEVIDYISLSYHFLSPTDLLIAGSVWDSLDAETQAIFEQAATEAANEQRQHMLESEAETLELIKGTGVKVNDDVNLAAFQELCVPVWDEFRDQIGSDILDEAIELAK